MNSYEKLEKFHGLRRSNQLVNVSLKHKYVWFKNAKVASSTLSKSLQGLEVAETPFLKTPPHPGIEAAVHIKPYQLPATEREAILHGDEFLRFTFVRNPFVRLVSAYKDKVVGNKKEKAIVLRALELPREALETEISFEQFIQSIHNSTPGQLDPHWMPQVLTTCARWTKHQLVGKIEAFQDAYEELGQRLGVDLNQFYNYHAPHRAHADDSFREYYSSVEIRQMVRTYYAEDFAQFNYDTELP